MLFVDFPNAVPRHTTEHEADLGLPFMEEYVESSSYGRLDLEFVPLHQWLRAADRHEDYRQINPVGDLAAGVGVAEEAIELADPHLDFTSIDVALIVLPSSHFRGGEGGSRRLFSTSEGTLWPGVRRQLACKGSRLAGKPASGGESQHTSFLHALGLLDHYSYGAYLSPTPTQDGPLSIGFGAMGLQALSPAGRGDPSGHGFRRAPEMLAWSRWQLGWLDDTQIECVTGDEASVTLGSGPQPRRPHGHGRRPAL